jgi:uncharacterized protein
VISLIEKHLPQIEAICRKYHVKRLDLFGSAAREDFDSARSDVDFFVEFEDRGWRGSFKRYIGLKLDLEELLGSPVDLVEPDAVRNQDFADVANRHRALVYAA